MARLSVQPDKRLGSTAVTSCANRRQRLMVSVSDTGIGTPEEERARVF